MSLVPVPEFQEMVAVARKYVAGEVHFSYLRGPAERCLLWAKVHGVHPALRGLAEEWLLLIDRVWNEWGTLEPLPEAELRRRIAEDLEEGSDRLGGYE